MSFLKANAKMGLGLFEPFKKRKPGGGFAQNT